MTGQNMLDRMEFLDRQLELQSGESDVTRGLLALNTAQDHFESLAALHRIRMGHTGTVTTAASTETTSFPTGLLRVDAVQFIDPDTSRPTYTLDPIDAVGGHTRTLPWPLYQRLATPTGKPRGYHVDHTNFYWEPLPDAVHTLRWYGFQRQSDITAVGTFAYDDAVALPVVTMAVEMLRRGADDPISDYAVLAAQVFAPTIQMLKRLSRERAPARQYAYTHDT